MVKGHKIIDELQFDEEIHYLVCIDGDTKKRNNDLQEFPSTPTQRNQNETFEVYIVIKKMKKTTFIENIFHRKKVMDVFDLSKGMDSKIVGDSEPSLVTVLEKSIKTVLSGIAEENFKVTCSKALSESREIILSVTVKGTLINEEFLEKLSANYTKELDEVFKLDKISSDLYDDYIKIRIEE